MHSYIDKNKDGWRYPILIPIILIIHCPYELFWLVVEPYPSEKYEFVSWDDDIPNMMGKS